MPEIDIKNLSQDFISVVMSTYNDEAYIGEAIQSILSQSHHDFELIIIDDGSSDKTLDIIKKYAEIDSRIRAITRENQGLSKSLNEGYRLARGNWIARMDADDISHPNRLEKQLALIQSRSADVCGTWIELFGAQQRTKRYFTEDNLIKTELLFGSPIGHATVLMRASLAKSLQYDPSFEHAEDYDYFERAAKAGWKFTNIPEILYRYRFHQKQTSSAKFDEQQVVSQRVRLRYWNSVATFYQLTPDEIQAVISLRDQVPSQNINIKTIDKVFEKILSKTNNDERAVILVNMIPLYIRIGGHGVKVYFSLNTLFRKYQIKIPLTTSFQLLFLGIFQIHVNSFIYKRLQNLYFKFSL